MKKAYEAPSIEKIAFNYRDQVVAASGGEMSGQNTGNNGSSLEYNGYNVCGVVDYFTERFGGTICSLIG